MTRPLLLTRNYWKYGFSSRTAVEALLAGFGGLWLFVQLVDFFRFPLAEQIRERPSVFILVGLAYAAWRSRRALSVTNRVAGRDIHIELRIADIFDLQGAFVISTNTTFETDTS